MVIGQCSVFSALNGDWSVLSALNGDWSVIQSSNDEISVPFHGLLFIRNLELNNAVQTLKEKTSFKILISNGNVTAVNQSAFSILTNQNS